jgi:hypothetical protein
MEVNGQLHTWQTVLVIQWIGGLVDSKTSLHMLVKKKCLPLPEIEP